MELGPDNPTSATNLSCSIANSGNFIWQWKLAGATNSLPQVGDRYNFHQELADVQTSSLEIRNLRRKDADMYVCEVRYENWEDILVASGTASLQLNCKFCFHSPIVRVHAMLANKEAWGRGYTLVCPCCLVGLLVLW